jgi:hypothetical protein
MVAVANARRTVRAGRRGVAAAEGEPDRALGLDSPTLLMRDLRHGPLLTSEQERALARRARGELARVPPPGDPRPSPAGARTRLIRDNLRLVVTIARPTGDAEVPRTGVYVVPRRRRRPRRSAPRERTDRITRRLLTPTAGVRPEPHGSGPPTKRRVPKGQYPGSCGAEQPLGMGSLRPLAVRLLHPRVDDRGAHDPPRRRQR